MIFAGDGADDISGGDGSDQISGGEGRDLLHGNDGNDQIWGDGGSDEIYGDAGKDSLQGGAGNDDLYGGAGADWLDGGAGDDRLYGGSGSDRLLGEGYGEAPGVDTLTGGADSDTFVFIEAAKTLKMISSEIRGQPDYLAAISVTDTITDFDTNGLDHDFIDLSHIMGTQSNLAPYGTAQNAIDQGYIRFLQHGTLGQAGFGTYVMVDLNGGSHGDAANNFTIADLQGVAMDQLRASLFIV
jgi:Ca2+-binding RTX toxin-like protein